MLFDMAIGKYFIVIYRKYFIVCVCVCVCIKGDLNTMNNLWIYSTITIIIKLM